MSAHAHLIEVALPTEALHLADRSVAAVFADNPTKSRFNGFKLSAVLAERVRSTPGVRQFS